MARYFIRFAYNGKHFHGWQIQPNANTVQQEMETALSLLLRQKTGLVGAGRTDTGVHAKEMYAHFNTEVVLDLAHLKYRLNRILPKSIVIYNIVAVGNHDHARFTAMARTYEYWIVHGKNPFLEDLTYALVKLPDFDLMNQACKLLYKYQDFTCFSKLHTQTKTNNCSIKYARWELKNDLWVFTITADRFLRNMVRAITGTLLQLGLGKITIAQFEEIIQLKNRNNAGESVPAQALYLTRVEYPKELQDLLVINK